MTSSLLHPPAHLPPTVALQLSQQAPALLRSTPSAISPYSISSLWSAAESPELWTTYENLMLSCLRTGDEQSAHLCLERLTERFGAENERLMALRGLFQEATAEDDAALKSVLEEYEKILAQDSSNMVCCPPRYVVSVERLANSVSLLPSVESHSSESSRRSLSPSQLLMNSSMPLRQMPKHGQSCQIYIYRRECTPKLSLRWKRCC